jgi:lysophospholipase L1-like esterase
VHVVVFDGNSLTAGFPWNGNGTGPNLSFPNGTDFPSVALRQLGGGWRGFNTGISARQLDETPGDTHFTPPGSSQIEDFDRLVAPALAQAQREGARTIVVVNCGEPGNLLYYATVDNADGGTQAVDRAYRAVQRYGQRVREAGALFVQTTIPMRVNASSPNINFREQIEAVNRLLRSRWRQDNLCDALIDVALEPRFGNPDDRTYYVDGTHLTVLGYTVLAECVVPVLEAIAGGQALTA